MAEEIRHPDGRIEHPGVRSEPSDASFGWIVAIMAGAVVTVLVLQLCVLVFFHRYQDHLAEINRSPYPLAPGPSLALPRAPRLEQIERLPPWASDKETKHSSASNAYERAAAKLRTLSSYGPADTEEFMHIPIERAMQLLVDKNMLKARPEPAGDERRRSAGLVDAGATNSGRLFKGAPK